MLELFLYKGHWQLATDNAIYSDGKRYRPLVVAFKEIKFFLPLIKNVLVLGSGVGSALQIMKSMNFHPSFLFIDSDEKILELARQLMADDNASFICADAGQFVDKDNNRYDLIIIDVFKDRQVPAFVSTTTFIEKCRERLNDRGIIIMNYMLNNKEDQEKFNLVKNELLQGSKLIRLGVNQVLVYSLAD